MNENNQNQKVKVLENYQHGKPFAKYANMDFSKKSKIKPKVKPKTDPMTLEKTVKESYRPKQSVTSKLKKIMTGALVASAAAAMCYGQGSDFKFEDKQCVPRDKNFDNYVKYEDSK